MQIQDICKHLEEIAPLAYQEDYDNSGLIVGRKNREVTGVLVSLDCVESTVLEAMEKDCNLIVAHHPIVFEGLKRFNGSNYVQRTIEMAIKYDIAIYAIHTNLDNVLDRGVNSRIADRLNLKERIILQSKTGGLLKLASYVPKENTEAVLNALFTAGAGKIGNYSACSFSTDGFGTFKGNEHSNPVKGKKGVKHTENEQKIEVILKKELQYQVLNALIKSHPYEEVAYEFYPTLNTDQEVGSGLIGVMNDNLSAEQFLQYLKKHMECDVIRFTPYNESINKVAVCGGSGSFLLEAAKQAGADAFVTADFKYHQFFDAENQLMICDLGHYESEKFTIDLLYDILTEKFATFAVLKTEGDTNPIKYFH
ncbi:MAG: Nif3-like dinuclear metal center hexameric protein [Bacteroidia bacterium]